MLLFKNCVLLLVGGWPYGVCCPPSINARGYFTARLELGSISAHGVYKVGYKLQDIWQPQTSSFNNRQSPIAVSIEGVLSQKLTFLLQNMTLQK
jgi:uncharacterized membrane protein YiaA